MSPVKGEMSPVNKGIYPVNGKMYPVKECILGRTAQYARAAGTEKHCETLFWRFRSLFSDAEDRDDYDLGSNLPEPGRVISTE